jgi:hypothetical protein
MSLLTELKIPQGLNIYRREYQINQSPGRDDTENINTHCYIGFEIFLSTFKLDIFEKRKHNNSQKE